MDRQQQANHEVLAAVRIRRDALYDAVMALEQSLAAPASVDPHRWSDEVHARVAEVRRVLERHVAETEHDGGFFADVLDRAPQLLPAIEQVQAQHGPLLAATDDLERAVDAARDDGAVDEVRSTGLELIHRVLEHRHRGAELVFDAYDVDISAID